jgi:hypothetical protein
MARTSRESTVAMADRPERVWWLGMIAVLVRAANAEITRLARIWAGWLWLLIHM